MVLARECHTAVGVYFSVCLSIRTCKRLKRDQHKELRESSSELLFAHWHGEPKTSVF